jgi:hypothetical protein
LKRPAIEHIQEWGAATPQLMAMKTGYDVEKVEGTGARTKTMNSWNHQPVELGGIMRRGGDCPSDQDTVEYPE